MNANDKKSLWIVAFLLILLVLFLVMIRGCDQKQLRDDQENHLNEPEIKDSEVVDQQIEDEKKSEESQSISSISAFFVKNATNNQIQEETNSMEKLKECFTEVMPFYQVEVGDSSFSLPTIHTEAGMYLKIEYFLKGLYENEYQEVSDFDINQLGIYKIIYHLSFKTKTFTKEVIVELQDTQAPIIEGIVERYNPNTGISSYEPVSSGSSINQMVQISFRDNHEVSYVEYYKAKYEMIGNVNTIEQEAMQEVISVDFNQDFFLYEDGEYHIRAYDFSGNVREYIVTIDRTHPVLVRTYSRIDKNYTYVMIESQEKLQPLSGWEVCNDGYALRKIYSNGQSETVTVFDLAGNASSIFVETEIIQISIDVYQNSQKTSSINLNTNDGIIFVRLQHHLEHLELWYSDGSSGFQLYQDENLIKAGHYTFQAVLDGIVMDTLEFDISEMQVGD